MQAAPHIAANACPKINCIQYEEMCPKLRRTPHAGLDLADGEPRAEPVHRSLSLRRRTTPEARVRFDRIGAVPLRKLFLVEREISLVAQRLDVLQIEAEPDLVIDIEIAQIRHRHR